MIGSLRGTVLDRSAIGEALVEVQGVGYRVTVAPGTLSGLGDVGAPVFLWVHHHVRDDAVTLYGEHDNAITTTTIQYDKNIFDNRFTHFATQLPKSSR